MIFSRLELTGKYIRHVAIQTATIEPRCGQGDFCLGWAVEVLIVEVGDGFRLLVSWSAGGAVRRLGAFAGE